MESKKSNKITDIVRLQRMLKKWKRLSDSSKNSSASCSSPSDSVSNTTCRTNGISRSSSCSSKSMRTLIKRTLSFPDMNSINGSCTSDLAPVPRGFLAVCVGKELKRYIIPTEYLGHEAFLVLLREAEEEFGFQQEGVLKIPCQVPVFEKILKAVQDKKQVSITCLLDMDDQDQKLTPDHDLATPHLHRPPAAVPPAAVPPAAVPPQLCR